MPLLQQPATSSLVYRQNSAQIRSDSINVISEYERLQQEMEEKRQNGYRLNLLIDATPDATMKIIMDPIAGDYISGKGSATYGQSSLIKEM